MPGLLRGMARTAAVAGTATAVTNRVSRRQAGRWAAEEPPAPSQPPPPMPAYQDDQLPEPAAVAPAGDGRAAQLSQLASLKDQGVLTDQEFAAEKARILGS